MKYSLPPPLFWQDFQELTLALSRRIYPNEISQIYGREGQTQNGIDIYVEGLRVGIQAKNRRLFNANGNYEPNGRIDIQEIEEIISEATKFKPALKLLVIATTALADKAVQNGVFQLNSDRKIKKKFQIEFWFWDRFMMEINNYQELLDLHYNKILPKVPGFDADAVLLATISDAFNRPALITPATCENCGDDFLQALKDVQEALTTGVSRDRLTREIRSRAIYGFRSAKSPDIRRFLRSAWEYLQETRNAFTSALIETGPDGRPLIEQQPNFVHIRDRRISSQINVLREKAIECVNSALKIKNCEPIHERPWF